MQPLNRGRSDRLLVGPALGLFVRLARLVLMASVCGILWL